MKPLLTIAIPTYNRLSFLENSLKQLMSQIAAGSDTVTICISDNASDDGTERLVRDFQQKFPGIISYQKNPSNLGFNLNMIEVMKMAEGEFVWLMGDDDIVAPGGIQKVINAIKQSDYQNIGLVALGHNSYYMEDGRRVVYFDTTDAQKPASYVLERKDVIRLDFPNSTFISVLIYQNQALKDVLEVHETLIREALFWRDYIHTFIYQLMFLKHQNLSAFKINEVIILEELHYYKFFVEDTFRLHYVAKKNLHKILMNGPYSEYRQIAAGWDSGLAKGVVIEMIEQRCFKTLNWSSRFRTIAVFFQRADLRDAILLSSWFLILSFAPPMWLKTTFKAFIKNRHKGRWEKVWFEMETIFSKMSQGQRRQLS
jgi:glycosyltransferase involved in cell wall biosynthesis